MAVHFLDSSCLLFRYLRDRPKSDEDALRKDRMSSFIEGQFAGSTPPVVSTLTVLETRGRLARLARNIAEATVELEVLEVDEARLEVWEPVTEDWSRAMGIAVTHALRGFDALQLAVFLRAQAKHSGLVMATGDHQLLAACSASGVPAIDPGEPM